MTDKTPELMEVLNKVWKTQPDAKLQELIGGVIREIISKPKMEIGISKSDRESIVFTSPQGRPTVTTLGRLMTRHLGYDPQKYSLAIQVITDAYLAEVRRANVSFDIVNGDDIVEAYKIEWGVHSCMTGSESKYTKFAAENKKIISMLLFKDKSTKARALLWSTDQGVKVLDRIYPNSGWHIDVIKKWAADLGMVFRISNALPSGGTIVLSNNKRHTVRVKNKKNIWSYMDTFTFGVKEKDDTYILSNSHSLINSKFGLQTTGGNPIEWNICPHCHGTIGPNDDSDEVYLDRRDAYPELWCDACADEFSFICGNCHRRIARKEEGERLCDCCKAEAKKQEIDLETPPQPISDTVTPIYRVSREPTYTTRTSTVA